MVPAARVAHVLGMAGPRSWRALPMLHQRGLLRSWRGAAAEPRRTGLAGWVRSLRQPATPGARARSLYPVSALSLVETLAQAQRQDLGSATSLPHRVSAGGVDSIGYSRRIIAADAAARGEGATSTRLPASMYSTSGVLCSAIWLPERPSARWALFRFFPAGARPGIMAPLGELAPSAG